MHVFTTACVCIILVLTPCSGALEGGNMTQTDPGKDSPFDLKSMLAQLLPSSGGDMRKQASQALEYLKFLYIGAPPEYTPSSTCLDHVSDFFQGVLAGEVWAQKMLDAVGKPESGVLSGNFKWLGSFDECVGIHATLNESGTITHPWKGQYCTSVFKLEDIAKQLGYRLPGMNGGEAPKLSIGICMPNSCSNKDLSILLYTLLEKGLQQNATLFSPYGYCLKDTLDLDTKAIVAIVICVIFLFLITIATIYDVILQHWVSKRTKVSNYSNGPASVYSVTNGIDGVKSNGSATVSYDNMGNAVITTSDKLSKMEMEEQHQEQIDHKPDTIGKALLAFSVYTNGSKILNTSQPRGTLTAVNGIRFISMTWVILGHNFAFQLPGASNVGDYYQAISTRFTFQAIANATVSVDSFFALSGLLVAYLSLKEMKKRSGARNFKWGMFYFHRFWRLTPPYMLFMMVYVCLARYLYNGPQWSQEGIDTKKCGNYWWRNILYINNLFPTKDFCMGWSWYLANDMQFYVLSPLMIIPLYYSAALGVLTCLALLAACCVSAGFISHEYHLAANMIFETENRGIAFDHLYDKPWTRIGPYVVGFFAGYVLYRTKCKIRMPTIVNLLGWLLAAAIAMSVLYGLYDESGKPPQLSNTVSSLYNATSRTAWAVAVCWVIVACATGHGGFVNTFLSWKAMIPLSRLTYCAYLVHPVVMYFYIMSTRKLLYFTDVSASYMFLGHLCVSYAVAFLVSLAFESPMMGLEKALLGREKNS